MLIKNFNFYLDFTKILQKERLLMGRIRSWIKKYFQFFVNKTVMASLLTTFILGVCYAFALYAESRIASGDFKYFITDFFKIATIGTIVGFFMIYPLILSVINLIILFFPKKRMRVIELITLLWGGFCTVLYMPLIDIRYDADWSIQLQNAERHAPIFTQALPTILTLICIAVIGYLVLSFVPLKKLPPLMIVLCFSALYLGMAIAVVWTVQIWSVFYLSLYAVNCIFIILKLMQFKIWEWTDMNLELKTTTPQNCNTADAQTGQQTPAAESVPVPKYQSRFLNACHHFLMKSSHWCTAAFLLMLPLLGILIAILTLFGQQPDAFIKAWTETSDWALSAQTAPQNLIVDGHYLCTVAAGGHRRIVKPLRMGERHGHAVIVNRQLMIANAFEQLLEEHTPRFHRHVRNFYDTYGFPVAKLIRSRFAADIVYFLMKPLEWLFLTALYLFDAKPENRIAVQYLPRRRSY